MLIDTHSHVDRYDRDGGSALKSALAEITQNRILTISNSMDLPSYERNLEIAELCNLVLPIFGVHPWNASQYANHLEDLELAIGQTPMLGEIGLDFHFIEDPSAYPAQVRVFEFLLAEASQRGMIAQLHTKGAELEVLRLLDNYRIPAAIVHWYSGPREVFKKMVARGFYFTVGVEVLYSERIQSIAREIPKEKLLTETDNPGGPKGFIGYPGMPTLLNDVVQGVAWARNTTVEQITNTVESNFLRLIRCDSRLNEIRSVVWGE